VFKIPFIFSQSVSAVNRISFHNFQKRLTNLLAQHAWTNPMQIPFEEIQAKDRSVMKTYFHDVKIGDKMVEKQFYTIPQKMVFGGKLETIDDDYSITKDGRFVWKEMNSNGKGVM
jgi:hypothetical protein